MLMPWSASVFPNQAFRSQTSTAVGIKLARASQHTPQEHEPDQCDSAHNQNDKHQSPRPCLTVPFVKGRNCVRENLQRQCRNRLVRAEAPELVPKSGEQQW